MKKVIRLTESDLERIIKKVITEQSTKFFEEVRNVNWTKRISKPEDVVSDSEPYKMPEYFKPYIGLTVSEPDFTAKIDDIAFGGAKPILKIKSLNPAYQEKDQEYDPEKYGFEGVMAEIKIGNSDSQAGFYYDCAGKQWKLWYNDKFRDKKIFNKKFFELGNFIQSKFCNSYITKPRREQA